MEGTYTCSTEYYADFYDLGSATAASNLSYTLPTGETSYATGSWSQQEGARTAYYWFVVLTVPGNKNLGGRKTIETNGGNTVDTCHYPGSPIAYWPGIRTQSGDVDSGNSYPDLIGLSEEWVACYRAGSGPGCYTSIDSCQVETDQNMSINRPGSPDYQYKTNRVKAGYGSTWVWSYRDGQSVSNPW